ncbi:MAG: hypothetical protein JSU06_08525 [Actinobacteria bacterium]|nr:hypothetical protein [Actinomycetota bacterium]
MGWFASTLLAVGLLLAAVPTSASAAQTRIFSGVSFGPDGTGGSESFVGPESVAVDRGSGDVYVYDIGAGRVYKFDAAGQPVDFSGLGANVIENVGGAGSGSENQVAVAPPGSPGGTAGDIYVANNSFSGLQVYAADGSALGELETGGETCGVATDPAGHLFVGVYPSVVEYVPASNPPSGQPARTSVVSERTCNVGADSLGTVYEAAFSGGAFRLEGIEATAAAVVDAVGSTIAVDPSDDSLVVNRGEEVAVYDSAGKPAYAFGAGEIGNSFGVAVSPSGDRVYVPDGSTGTVKAFGPALSIPTTGAATAVRAESATLSGTLQPEGRQYTGCRFEYGLAAASGFGHEADCEPGASQIPPDSSTHAVGLSLTHLQSNKDYKYRLSATNALGTLRGETLTFSTVGPPRFPETLARDATENSATLEGTIDPRGADTSYRIEWGPTSAYGHVAASGTIGSNQGPTVVSGQISGLSSATRYHYRVTAVSSEGGEAAGPDQTFETLDSCGLTDGRCLELVSPPERGPLAKPGKPLVGRAEPQFQAASTSSALAYVVELGYPEATSGDEAVYLARRGAGGWLSEQVTPPTLVAPKRFVGARNSGVKVLSPDLGCAIVASSAPLLADAPATAVEAGGSNLYRRDNATGSYQLITSLPPVGPPTPSEVFSTGGMLLQGEYLVLGMSPDCRRVVFRTMYRYPGIPSTASSFQLYEWDRGVIRNVALIPGPGGAGEPVPAESVPGALPQLPDNPVPPIGAKASTDYWHAVSADGSHTVFTAISRLGGDRGWPAIFLRDGEDPAELAGTAPAVDVSQSETATPNEGDSRYWTASADGTRVFFTARYGLAANGSSSGATSCSNAPAGTPGDISGAGCDLYEYDAAAPAGERLTDLSPDTTDAKGAGVVGVLDASEDGSYVYFAARGRLGGVGRSERANLDAGTYNIFLAHAGGIHFVAPIAAEATEAGVLDSSALVGTRGNWTSRATPDGKRFVFESSLGVPGGVTMVYLFSAADGRTVCASCRRDGEAPYSARKLTPLIDAQLTDAEDRTIQPTILSDDGKRLYFYSFDPLAIGAVEGRRNLFQWEDGQVSLIATEPAGVPSGGRVGGNRPSANFFGGASAGGGDVYFATPQALVGSDRNEGWDVYDARVGGGFPEPLAPSPPCDAGVEGLCNGSRSAVPDQAGAATSTFNGPSNPPVKKHKPKGHKRKPSRARRHGKKHASKPGGTADRSSANGRAAR